MKILHYELAVPMTVEIEAAIQAAWERFLSDAPKDTAWTSAYEKHQKENETLYSSMKCNQIMKEWPPIEVDK